MASIAQAAPIELFCMKYIRAPADSDPPEFGSTLMGQHAIHGPAAFGLKFSTSRSNTRAPASASAGSTCSSG